MSKLRQVKLVAAAVMVMPRSRSCGIQSICASPSCTSPILWMRPERKRKRSLTVVLPASMCATMPILRTRDIFELAGGLELGAGLTGLAPGEDGLGDAGASGLGGASMTAREYMRGFGRRAYVVLCSY